MLDMILTIVVLSFWIVFPIAIYLSVAHVDKLQDSVAKKTLARRKPRSALNAIHLNHTSHHPHGV